MIRDLGMGLQRFSFSIETYILSIELQNDEMCATDDDSSTTADNIICIFAVRFFEIFATSQAIASHLVEMRKVRTAQSNAPVKSRVVCTHQQIVPQKITTLK
jgi:hypothetical protein